MCGRTKKKNSLSGVGAELNYCEDFFLQTSGLNIGG